MTKTNKVFIDMMKLAYKKIHETESVEWLASFIDASKDSVGYKANAKFYAKSKQAFNKLDNEIIVIESLMSKAKDRISQLSSIEYQAV